MAAVALGLIASAIVVVASAVASPEWAGGTRFSFSRVKLEVPQARSALTLSLFGVTIGLPIALGLVQGFFLLGPGALAALFAGRILASESPDLARNGGFITRVASSPHSWFIVITWSLLAMYVRLETVNVASHAAAQAALGATLLLRPAVGIVAVVLALASGLVAALMWFERLPQRRGLTLEPSVKWAESAVAPSLIAASAFGPSLSALAGGPLGISSWVSAAISFAVMLATIAAVSFARRYEKKIPAGPALIASSGVALVAIFMSFMAAQ